MGKHVDEMRAVDQMGLSDIRLRPAHRQDSDFSWEYIKNLPLAELGYCTPDCPPDHFAIPNN